VVEVLDKGFDSSLSTSSDAGYDIDLSNFDPKWGVLDADYAKNYGYLKPGSYEDIDRTALKDGDVIRVWDGNQWRDSVTRISGGEGTGYVQSEESHALNDTGGCMDIAADQLYNAPGEASNSDPFGTDKNGIATLMNQTHIEIQSDARITALLGSWSECMARSGYAYDSPETPAKFNWKGTPKEQEITTATTDVNCKQEVGFLDIWYAITREHQQATIDTHLPIFTESRNRNKALIARALSISLKKNRLEYILKSPKLHSDNITSYISNFTTDIDIACDVQLSKIMIFSNLATFILSFILTCRISILLCLVLMAISSLSLLPPVLARTKLASLTLKYSEGVSKYIAFIEDILSGVKEIFRYNKIPIFSNKNEENSLDVESKKCKKGVYSSIVATISGGIGQLTFAIAMIFGGFLVFNGKIEVGALIALIQLMNGLVNPLVQMSGNVNAIISGKDVVNNLKLKPCTIKSNHIDLDKNYNLTVENVSFSYESNPVFTNFSYEFKHGKRYAITGASGVGKSTLVKLLTKELVPISGEIKLGNYNIQNIEDLKYNDLISVIQQNSHVFNDSIINNLTLFDTELIDIDKLHEIMRMTKISDFIINDEMLNDNMSVNEGLSGGQKQRIMIARALIQNQKVLIMDESTNALDNETNIEVISNLTKLKDLTIICVTHNINPNFLNYFDEVLDLSEVSRCR
jgi:ABC-type multidrug transport system fused ATPase/permease subunit